MGIALSEKDFCSTPVVSPTGHSRTLEQTEGMLDRIRDKVPITRVYDATPLDFLGLPVWCAVTPLANDLTVHAGKGATHQASRVSAMMEAVERVCGESVDPARTTRASLAELPTGLAIDPVTLDLPFDTAYRPDRPIRWTRGFELIAGQVVHVPVDAVISPAVEGICHGVETNGLASGNTLTEATLHAVLEVIERHVVSEARFYDLHHDPHSCDRPPAIVDNATLPAPVSEWVADLTRTGIRVIIRDLTTDLEIPVLTAYLVDDSFAGTEGEDIAFAGYGADLTVERALTRAVTEAVQSHTGVLLGARDAFEGDAVVSDRAASLARHLRVIHPRERQPLRAAAAQSDDLLDDLNSVLSRLRACGFPQCVVVELTRPEIGVPVVRVLIPGMAHPYGETNRRPSLRLLRSIV